MRIKFDFQPRDCRNPRGIEPGPHHKRPKHQRHDRREDSAPIHFLPPLAGGVSRICATRGARARDQSCRELHSNCGTRPYWLREARSSLGGVDRRHGCDRMLLHPLKNACRHRPPRPVARPRRQSQLCMARWGAAGEIAILTANRTANMTRGSPPRLSSACAVCGQNIANAVHLFGSVAPC
jgi:hypothetical protein